MLSALVLASAVALAPLPPTDSLPDDPAAWGRYTRTMLTALFPEHSETIVGLRISIIEWPEPNAFSQGRVIAVTTGLIELMGDEAEYASILAHEFGHMVLNHKSPRVRGMFGLPGEDMVLLEKQDTEADRFAMLVLRRAGLPPCSSAIAFGHILDADGTRDDSENPFAAMSLRREAAIVSGCNQLLLPSAESGQFKAALWRVYIDIVLQTVWPDGAPFTDIVVVEQDDYIAYFEYLTGKMSIGPELLRQVREPDELAFIVAHEAAHGILQHLRQYRTAADFVDRDYKGMERRELAADAYAFLLLHSRGLNSCAGLPLEQRLAELFNQAAEPSEPAGSTVYKQKKALNRIAFKRIDALKKCCRVR